MPDPDAAAALYEITQEMTAARGLAAYEISNHATPGAESRHNLLYWRYGEYAGIGPGAHGRLLTLLLPPWGASRPPPPRGEGLGVGGIPDVRLGNPSAACRCSPHPRTLSPFQVRGNGERGAALRRLATVAERNPEQWAARVEEFGHGFIEQTPLAPPNKPTKCCSWGCDCSEGVDLARLAAIGGVRPSRAVVAGTPRPRLIQLSPPPRAATENWRANELSEIPMCAGPGLLPDAGHAPWNLEGEPARIRATPRGRFVLNAVVAKLSMSFEPVASTPAMDICPGPN